MYTLSINYICFYIYRGRECVKKKGRKEKACSAISHLADWKDKRLKRQKRKGILVCWLKFGGLGDLPASLAAQKSCLIHEALDTPLFQTAKALHSCFLSPWPAGVPAGLYSTISLVKVLSASPRHGAELTSHSHPKSPDFCVMLSTNPNSREKESLFLTGPIIFICSAPAHLLHKKLLKTGPTAKLCHQCVPSRALAAVLISELLRCLSQPSSSCCRSSSSVLSLDPCAGRGQLPLPPAFLFLTYDMN